MNVLLQSRVSLYSAPGGDTVQVERTAEALRACGVAADISLELEPDLSGYDLVHLFNLTRVHETYLQAENAKRQGRPVALSTIYWNEEEYERQAHGGLRRLLMAVAGREGIEYARIAFRYCANGERNRAARELLRHGYRALQRRVLAAADILLPNAQAEMQCLERDFGKLAAPYAVVPNAAEQEFCPSGPAPWAGRNCVLCAGRVEPRKNQLALVRALRGTGIPLVLAGCASLNHGRYYEAVRRAAPPGTVFAGQLGRAEMREAYDGARVHALPSWFETPGLASLEAAARGCNLVVSDRGSTREYFAEHAEYCEPGDEASIRAAVLRAWRSPPRPELRRRIAARFTWEEAARATVQAYLRVLPARTTAPEALPAGCTS